MSRGTEMLFFTGLKKIKLGERRNADEDGDTTACASSG